MKIGLTLSGGGIRAAVFHLGVLARFACSEHFDQVSRLSTVSGGSLVAATIICHSGMRWPTSSDYLTKVLPQIRELYTSRHLLTLSSFISRPQYLLKVFHHRAWVLSHALESRWGVSGSLQDLPDNPQWFLNATCVETGKNWRFCKRFMGDWKFGRHFSPNVSISDAAAASAAVPYVIGALKLDLPSEGWYSTNPATGEPTARKVLTEKCVRLWDGGAYENLGLEPLYKPGRGMIDVDCIFVSDASGPLPQGGSGALGALLKGNLASPRLFDIASDQIRSLRSRSFIQELLSGSVNGAVFRMGNSVRDIDLKTKQKRDDTSYGRFQSDEKVSVALRYPTNLSVLMESDFDSILRHGFELTEATLTAYHGDVYGRGFEWADLQEVVH